MKTYDEIVNILLADAIRITEKIEEDYSIDYACINYFYDSEALDIGVNFIKSDQKGKCERCYYSLLDGHDELFSEIFQFPDVGSSLEEIMGTLYERYKQTVSKTSNFEIELEEID